MSRRRRAADRLNQAQNTLVAMLGSAQNRGDLLMDLMSWLTHYSGDSNIVVWITGKDAEDSDMASLLHSSTPGSVEEYEVLKRVVLPAILEEKFINWPSLYLPKVMSSGDRGHFPGHCFIGVRCDYQGVHRLAVTSYRPADQGFSGFDQSALEMINPLFGIMFRRLRHAVENDGPKPKTQPPQDSSEWWRRGGSPPAFG
ncbi:hypothetical protein KW782_02100 [Candidatus Parcubacteria bacterium]|nr:hypothetical protein [Candidatus Parcubacteria bacterium]